jgi:hypothetical protein
MLRPEVGAGSYRWPGGWRRRRPVKGVDIYAPVSGLVIAVNDTGRSRTH